MTLFEATSIATNLLRLCRAHDAATQEEDSYPWKVIEWQLQKMFRGSL
jgi:hypothetical protein